MSTARLSPGHVRDYQELLEHVSALVLVAVKRHDFGAIRRWASSLAHVGNVLLDDREHRGPKRAA
jgi:hypothetical protein